jgi:hypothetical protein
LCSLTLFPPHYFLSPFLLSFVSCFSSGLFTR